MSAEARAKGKFVSERETHRMIYFARYVKKNPKINSLF